MSSNASTPRSLRTQLLLWLLGPLLLLFVVNSVLAYRVAISTANQAYDRLLLASVKAIADRVTVSGGEISVDIPYVALELFESNIRERIFYKVSAADGLTLTGYEDLPAPPASAGPPNRVVFFRSEYHGESLYQAAIWKELYDPSIHGKVLVQVGETSESRDALSHQILFDGLLRQGLLITLATLVLLLGIRHSLKPLLGLRNSIAARASEDLTPVDERGVQAEVRPLIQALNQHTGRIGRMIDARVSFVADATHQVRTRLAILKTQVGYAMRTEDPAAIRDAIANTSSTIDETTRFFSQLLVLAHAEAKAVAGHDHAPVDLAALAHAVTHEWVERARAKQINLAFEGAESGLRVRGNELLLRELVTNLMDNAIRYSHDGGSVTVRVRDEHGDIVFSVEDDGPGIPEAERERVFDRFYRILGARGEGSGLGLSIAREICRSHDATIALFTPEGGGLRVEVRLHPMAPEPTSAGSPFASA
jgi:two-component system sensor histidine kinase TctE